MDVDVDGGRGVDPRQFLDRERRQEDGAACTTELLGHLDPHDPQLEELGDQLRPHLGRFVHLMDVRRNLGLGEFADGFAKEGFLFGEHGQRSNGCFDGHGGLHKGIGRKIGGKGREK